MKITYFQCYSTRNMEILFDFYFSVRYFTTYIWIVFSYISCLTLFFISLWILIQKHIEEYTSISVELVREKAIQLPTLTFCSEEPFKVNGYHYLEKDFLKNSFGLSDIFGPQSIVDFKNHPEVSNFYHISTSILFFKQKKKPIYDAFLHTKMMGLVW